MVNILTDYIFDLEDDLRNIRWPYYGRHHSNNSFRLLLSHE